MKFPWKIDALFKRQAVPKACLLTVTNSCMLSCKMCYLWQLDTVKDEMTIEECKRLMDKLEEFGRLPKELHLIGGEPLLKKGIFELIRHINSKGINTVMTSCGYTIDKKIAEELAASGLNILNISLDSLRPEIHNFLRGRGDCFQRVIEALDYLGEVKRDKLRLEINTVISASNLDDLLALVEWVNGNRNIDSIYFMAVVRPFGSALGWDWHKRSDFDFLWPRDTDKAHAILNQIIARKKKGDIKIANPVGQLESFKLYFKEPDKFIKTRRCNLTHCALNVNALGDIYLCFFKDAIGNARDASIKELWFSEKADAVRREIANCRQNCELMVNCYYEN